MKKIRIIFYLLIAMCLSVTTYAEAEMGGYAHIEGINQIGLADAENHFTVFESQQAINLTLSSLPS